MFYRLFHEECGGRYITYSDGDQQRKATIFYASEMLPVREILAIASERLAVSGIPAEQIKYAGMVELAHMEQASLPLTEDEMAAYQALGESAL